MNLLRRLTNWLDRCFSTMCGSPDHDIAIRAAEREREAARTGNFNPWSH